AAERQRFTETAFIRGSRGNRQGVQLEFNGAPFVATDQLLLLSEVMVVGDVQMTGNGAPFILLPECQTTGGYPRIGTVLPQDVPYVAQATPGCALEFEFVSQKAALESYLSYTQIYQALKSKVVPLLRNPHDIKDLLSYQLISGVTAGYDE
ncbi:MAG: urea amidolyase, partial [Paracoccaceae bacterium]|nr:urea amidolyase [Paracoccaceae bacterium]